MIGQYRATPGSLTQDPRSKAGLRGKTAVDMAALNPWGSLAAVKQGGCSFWWFQCSEGHEFLLCGQNVRSQSKKGIDPVCPICNGKAK